MFNNSVKAGRGDGGGVFTFYRYENGGPERPRAMSVTGGNLSKEMSVSALSRQPQPHDAGHPFHRASLY